MINSARVFAVLSVCLLNAVLLSALLSYGVKLVVTALIKTSHIFSCLNTKTSAFHFLFPPLDYQQFTSRHERILGFEYCFSDTSTFMPGRIMSDQDNLPLPIGIKPLAHVHCRHTAQSITAQGKRHSSQPSYQPHRFPTFLECDLLCSLTTTVRGCGLDIYSCYLSSCSCQRLQGGETKVRQTPHSLTHHCLLTGVRTSVQTTGGLR